MPVIRWRPCRGSGRLSRHMPSQVTQTHLSNLTVRHSPGLQQANPFAIVHSSDRSSLPQRSRRVDPCARMPFFQTYPHLAVANPRETSGGRRTRHETTAACDSEAASMPVARDHAVTHRSARQRISHVRNCCWWRNAPLDMNAARLRFSSSLTAFVPPAVYPQHAPLDEFRFLGGHCCLLTLSSRTCPPKGHDVRRKGSGVLLKAAPHGSLDLGRSYSTAGSPFVATSLSNSRTKTNRAAQGPPSISCLFSIVQVFAEHSPRNPRRLASTSGDLRQLIRF